MKGILGVLVGAALGIGAMTAGANAQSIRDPAKPISDFGTGHVVAIMSELGFTARTGRLPSGKDIVVVTTDKGLNILLLANDDGSALLFAAFFEDKVSDAQIVALNRRHDFLKAAKGDDGTLNFSRYIIAPYGIPRGNIAVNAIVFDSMVRETVKEMADASNTGPLASVIVPPEIGVPAALAEIGEFPELSQLLTAGPGDLTLPVNQLDQLTGN